MPETTDGNARLLDAVARGRRSAVVIATAKRELFEALRDMQSAADDIDGPSITLKCAAESQVAGALEDAVRNLDESQAGDAWSEAAGRFINARKLDATRDVVAFSLFDEVHLGELVDLFQLLELAVNGFPQDTLHATAA